MKSQHNRSNKFHVINMYVLSIIRFPVSIVNWPKENIEAVDLKIQRFLIMYRVSTPSPILRNCTSARKNVGRIL